MTRHAVLLLLFLLAVVLLLFALVAAPAAAAVGSTATREFPVAAGGLLTLDLKAGGDVRITGDGGSSVKVTYSTSCEPHCGISFDTTKGGVTVSTAFKEHRSHQSSDVDLEIHVPSSFDVTVASMGGDVSIGGVDGKFTGETKGGDLTLRDVKGEAELTTMGGEIKVTDSTLDGALKTMGGEVTIENVVGNVKGSSMGGNVRYRNVHRRDGQAASPERVGKGKDEISPETVQISTMGGDIEVKDAPEGADVHTMGGDITVENARRFVRAKTMGGDLHIGPVDGSVNAATMGGDGIVTLTGGGGDVDLASLGGEITLRVPQGFGMDLDLEIAYTRNSRQDYKITAPGGLKSTVSPDWDYDKGSPRKYIRMSGAVNGGGKKVKVSTINGNITISE